MKVMAREWRQFDTDWEFRCFVFKKQMTAISVYNNLGYYPEMIGKEEKIKTLILEGFDQVKDLLAPEFETYIIDFAIVDEKAVIIEVNPFGPMTGPSLFDWNADRYLLQRGEDHWKDDFGGNSKIVDLSNLPQVRVNKKPPAFLTMDYVKGYFGSDLFEGYQQKSKPPQK